MGLTIASAAAVEARAGGSPKRPCSAPPATAAAVPHGDLLGDPRRAVYGDRHGHLGPAPATYDAARPAVEADADPLRLARREAEAGLARLAAPGRLAAARGRSRRAHEAHRHRAGAARREP